MSTIFTDGDITPHVSSLTSYQPSYNLTLQARSWCSIGYLKVYIVGVSPQYEESLRNVLYYLPRTLNSITFI